MLPRRIPKEAKPEKRWRSPAHLAFVRSHECCVPGCSRRPIEAAHVRTGTGGGMGMKPADYWVISLCGSVEGHHAEQHNIGEAAFEKKYGIDMKALATEFAFASPKSREIMTARSEQ